MQIRVEVCGSLSGDLVVPRKAIENLETKKAENIAGFFFAEKPSFTGNVVLVEKFSIFKIKLPLLPNWNLKIESLHLLLSHKMLYKQNVGVYCSRVNVWYMFK